MIFNQLNNRVKQVSGRISLRTVLVIPFVLQILEPVELVGYFSFKNGQHGTALVMERSERLAPSIKQPDSSNRRNVTEGLNAIASDDLTVRTASHNDVKLWLCLMALALGVAINILTARSLERRVANRTAAEHKQVEETLRRQEQQLRLITDALPVCICYVDSDKRYRFVNKTYEDWFGWRQHEILGKHYREVLGETVYQVIKPHSNRTLAGAVTTYEAEMPYLLGKKYISATLIPDVDDRGQVKGYYGLISDIGDRKRAEAASVLEERNRIARELHDTLAQALAGIIIHLEAASLKLATDVESTQALIQTGRDLARSGLAEARRSVEALRPLVLENCDLYSALQKFAEQMFSCTESKVICHRLGHPYPLESSVENNVFRIGQEALHNILKHAEASEIKMELVYERSHFTLRVTDNGQGFVVDHNAVRRFGLLGMTERAERMGASFIIQSVPNQGTTVTLSVDRRNI
jgi:PAS domain S-box-containing protein